MTASLQDLAAQALRAATDAGAEAADVVAARGDGISMEVRGGELEQAQRAEGVDIGLRVLIGHKQASVSISDTRDAAISAMAARAVAMAREAPDDPHCGLADPGQLATNWDMDALDLADRDPLAAPDTLADFARRAEAAALAVKGVAQVSSAGASSSDTSVWLMASNGFSGGYRKTSTGMSCVAITGEGLEMQRDYAFDSRIHAADLMTPEEIGTLAGERAVAMFGASRPKTGAFPVIFDERVSSGLIGHMLSAINGATIARGSSWLKTAMGEEVLPTSMSLVEEPHRPRVSGSRPFDGEGLPTQDNDIVRYGLLKRWILDLATGRKLGLPSTANAARGVGSPPSPSVGNVRLIADEMPRDKLIAETGEGLLVTSMIGSTINPNTGDYSRGCSGFWIRGGAVAEPVNECTIAGNLRDMLRTLSAADDARPWLSRVVPSLRVEGLTIAGS